MIEGLARLLDLGEAGIAGFILVFCAGVKERNSERHAMPNG